MANVAIGIINLLFVVFLSYLAWLIFRSSSTIKLDDETKFFLPISFFTSLILLVHFWLILLLIIGAEQIVPDDKAIIIIIASLLAPFVTWWRQKKVHEL